MPIYEYGCTKCAGIWDVVKSVSVIDSPETCPRCEAPGDRRLSRVNFSGASDWNTQTFNPGLGCYTKSNAHARMIARGRGLEEVGNEKPETIHRAMEKKREENRAERWRDADRVKLYE